VNILSLVAVKIRNYPYVRHAARSAFLLHVCNASVQPVLLYIHTSVSTDAGV